MFTLLQELIVNSKDLDEDSQSRIFLASLNFYNGETSAIEQGLLRDSMQLLISSPNLKQALGLANYVFFNEVEFFAKMDDLLKKLDVSNPATLQLMHNTW